MISHLRRSRRAADDRVESLLSGDPYQLESGELATMRVALGSHLADDPVQTVVADAHGGRKRGIVSGAAKDTDRVAGVERRL